MAFARRAAMSSTSARSRAQSAHVVPDAAQVDRECRAPAARAEDRDRPLHALAPKRRSVPVAQTQHVRPVPEDDDDRGGDGGQTRSAPGCRARRRAAAARSTRRTEPSEMYLVSHTAAANMASAGGTASGDSTVNTPHAGRHAFAAAEAQPDRINVADNRRRAPPRPARRRLAHADRQPHAGRALAMSSAATSTLQSRPDARITFAAPRLPLPVRRRRRRPIAAPESARRESIR